MFAICGGYEDEGPAAAREDPGARGSCHLGAAGTAHSRAIAQHANYFRGDGHYARPVAARATSSTRPSLGADGAVRMRHVLCIVSEERLSRSTLSMASLATRKVQPREEAYNETARIFSPDWSAFATSVGSPPNESHATPSCFSTRSSFASSL